MAQGEWSWCPRPEALYVGSSRILLSWIGYKQGTLLKAIL